MAVIKRGILGGGSGSVGNVVLSSWKGIATMKAKPLSVANPNTAAQIEQRTKMENIVAFAKVILSAIIKPLNDRFASGMSGFNLFVQRNIALFENIAPTPYGDLILALGNVTPISNGAITADASDGEVEVTWTNNTGVGNALATDVLYIVAYNETINDFLTDSGSNRADQATQLDMPATWLAGHTVRVWVAYRRLDGTQVSNTAAFTTVIVA